MSSLLKLTVLHDRCSASVSLLVLGCCAGRGEGSDGGKEVALKLRIPSWAVGEGVRVEVNRQEWGSCRAAAHLAGSYCTVRRAFAAGSFAAPLACLAAAVLWACLCSVDLCASRNFPA